MSESNRKVCGEDLSLALQDRDVRVVGKSVSREPYASIKIGSVGKRIADRMALSERSYQHFLPKTISRFFGSKQRSLWNNSYHTPEIQYLLWMAEDEELEAEVEQAPPSAWMKTKKPWVGARVFRMPKSTRTATERRNQFHQKPTNIQREFSSQQSKIRPIQRLRAKNDQHKVLGSTPIKALASLPPFLATSKRVQKVVRQGMQKVESTNPYRPQSITSQFFDGHIQRALTPENNRTQHAKGRMRSQKPTGLRPLQLSSPMLQELIPATERILDSEEVEVQKTSPWFTRAPAAKEKNTAAAIKRSQKRNKKAEIGETSALRNARELQSISKNRSVLSSLGRSFRRAVQNKKRPSQHIAKNISLGMNPQVQETPASVHALQRSALVSEATGRSVLPISSVFSEQGNIGKRIARHQASMFADREQKIGTKVAHKADVSVPNAQKRSQVRRPQLFSMPDLLDIQSHSHEQPIASVQEKTVSPWFTREPAKTNRSSQSSLDQKSTESGISRQESNRYSSFGENRVVGLEEANKRLSAADKMAQKKEASQEIFPTSVTPQSSSMSSDQEIPNIDIFGFTDSPSSRPSRYAEQRLSQEEGLLPKITPQSRESGYQPLDQKSQERISARWEENSDQFSRMEASLPHQVRERRYVSSPDFVPVQHDSDTTEDLTPENAPKESPWFTRSPVVHAANRQEGRATQGSILPKVAVPTERILSRKDTRTESASKEETKSGRPNPVQSALAREPIPSRINPSRPQIVRNTQEQSIDMLRSSGLDHKGKELAKIIAQNPNKEAKFSNQNKGWAEFRFRREAPISYARQTLPDQVVVQIEENEVAPTTEENPTESPWFTRAPTGTENREATVQPGAAQMDDRALQEVLSTISGLPRNRQAQALSYMLARSEAEISLPQERMVGTKSRSLFSVQPTIRLSTLPPTMNLAEQSQAEENVEEQTSPTSTSPWFVGKEPNTEKKAANALLKRVAKLGVKAKIYKSPKGTMMDAKAARALGFSPPKGKSRIPLTWILEAVENKSSSGILPNWAQRSSGEPLHRGETELITSINRASSMDDIIKVIFERSGAKNISPAFQDMPVEATKVLQSIRKEAHQLQLVQEQSKEEIMQVEAKEKGFARTAKNVVSNFTGLKPLATAPIASMEPRDDKLSNLTRKLEDLILIAEQQGKRDAQGGARLAEDSAQAIEEGRSEPRGIDEDVDEQLNLDQLYRDVFRAVEDAINLKRVLRFDNDDHFDGGW